MSEDANFGVSGLLLFYYYYYLHNMQLHGLSLLWEHTSQHVCVPLHNVLSLVPV